LGKRNTSDDESYKMMKQMQRAINIEKFKKDFCRLFDSK